MIEGLKKYELPNVLLTQILSSNPHAAKSGRISTEMESRTVPFEEYQKAQINQGLSIFSSKEHMELAMAGLLGVRGEALGALFLAIDNDESVTDKTMAKLALLNEDIYFTDLLIKIDLLAACGQYEAARQLTTLANDYYRLMPEDKIDMEAMYDLLEIQEALNSTSESALLNSQEAALYEMLNTTSAAVSTKCLNLLITHGGNQYLEPITENEFEKRNNTEVLLSKGSEMLNLYPNPATNMIQITYPSAGSVRIEVYDVLGHLILQQNVQNFATQFILDISELPSALYDLRLIDVVGVTLVSNLFIKQ